MEPKVLFIMIDGLGDSANPDFSGKTYLQEARLEVLSRLVNTGLSGMIDPVETGLACGSDTAHMSIFGYPPYKHYQGRGSFETMGSGLELNDDEIAFKCNFACMNTETGIVTHRRVSRRFYQWGLEMIDSINGLSIEGFEDYKVTVKHATEHRCGLKITGPNLSHQIEGTDPLKDDLPLLVSVPWDPTNPNQVLSANIVNAASQMIHKILASHPINLARIKNNKRPANLLLLRGAGIKLKVKSFDQMYGVKSFFIAPTAIIKGWGITINTQIIEVQGATGDVHSNHQNKFDMAAELLNNSSFDFGFLHIKAIDDLAHDKNNKDRLSLIEKIDRLIGECIEKIRNCVIVVTGDHSTNTHIGDHSFEPVPFVINFSENYRKGTNGELRFNEIDCAKGKLGRFPGSEVMPLIFRYRQFIKATELV